MKISIFIFGCLIFGLLGCYKENNTQLLENTFFETEVNPIYEYNFIKEPNKQLIYSEDFEDENGDWWMGEEDGLKADIRFGEYQLSHLNNDLLQWLYTNWSVDPDRDFEIEATIRINSSADDDGGGFGISDSDGNWIAVVMNHKNEVSVNKWNKAQEKLSRLLDWQEKYWINSFEGTSLTIRKVDNQYVFFADKKYIAISLNQDELTPSRIIFYLKGNVTMYVEAITMHYIVL